MQNVQKLVLEVDHLPPMALDRPAPECLGLHLMHAGIGCAYARRFRCACGFQNVHGDHLIREPGSEFTTWT